MAEVMAPPGESFEEGEDEAIRRGAAIIAGLRPPRPRVSRSGPLLEGYVIPPDGKIGEGRFSEVYRARDLNLSRDVAIKLLRKGHQSDEVQRARMENEAQALARLQSTNASGRVVQIYDRSKSAEGHYFLVLEWLEHGSLQDRLNESGPMPARAAASIVRTIAEVVHAVHEIGIIHRDLKPSNVLLTRDDQPKLADFGLARFDREREGLTLDGEILGTPEFMAPEQARGRSAEVGEASDIYSIGAILYACLTGRPPFQGPSSGETLATILSDDEPVPPEVLVPSVPRDLSTICLKCLHKKTDARYPSAKGLADDLGRFLDGRPILARRAGPAERLAKSVRRNPLLASMVGLVVLSVLVGLVATGLYARKAMRQEVRATKNAEQRFLALAKVLDLITGDKLRRSGQRALQVQLINDLLPRFDEVLKLEGDDPETRKLQGLAWLSLSTARRELGQMKDAREAAENAEKIMRDLIAADALTDEASVGLSTALGYQGTILGQGGKFAEAISRLEEADRLLVPLVNDETPALLQRLAHVHNTWANCLRFGGGGTPAALQAADQHYRTAIDLFGRAARSLPTSRDWQARTLSNLALFVGEDLKRPDEAVQLAERAADQARGLIRDFPDDLDSRECLASCLTNVGDLRMLRGEVAAVRPLYIDVLALYERLSSQVPDSTEFRWSVAMAASNLANSLMTPPGEDLPKAAEHLRRADVLYRQLVKESPENKDLAGYAALNQQRLDALQKLQSGAR